jgi:hypothetical protein
MDPAVKTPGLQGTTHEAYTQLQAGEKFCLRELHNPGGIVWRGSKKGRLEAPGRQVLLFGGSRDYMNTADANMRLARFPENC